MRGVTAVVVCGLALAAAAPEVIGAPAQGAPSRAAAPPASAPLTPEAIQKWMYGYRQKPDPGRLPVAVQAMSRAGLLKDPESAGLYVGFIAGVLGTNPSRAEALVGKMLPLHTGDDWVIVRAIAYSGLADWKGLMGRVAGRIPTRRPMIEAYLSGKLAILDDIPLDDDPTFMEKVRAYVPFTARRQRKVTLDSSPEFLDTLWGYYFATGAYRPIARIVSVLPWARERGTVDRLTVGSMARFTLASNAARDPELLAMLRNLRQQQPKHVAVVLNEVIEAAEMVDTTRLRKEALAAIEELKRKGSDYKRNVSFWGQVGEGTLAAGCVVAAVLGQIELGLPCVIGGALTSGALRMWSDQQQ